VKIAQIAPLYESVPPRLYGGTERIVRSQQARMEQLPPLRPPVDLDGHHLGKGGCPHKFGRRFAA
jgi:hypothetical protein